MGYPQTLRQGNEDAGAPVLKGTGGLKKVKLEEKMGVFHLAADERGPPLPDGNGFHLRGKTESLPISPDRKVTLGQLFFGKTSIGFNLEEASAGTTKKLFVQGILIPAGKTGIGHKAPP